MNALLTMFLIQRNKNCRQSILTNQKKWNLTTDERNIRQCFCINYNNKLFRSRYHNRSQTRPLKRFLNFDTLSRLNISVDTRCNICWQDNVRQIIIIIVVSHTTMFTFITHSHSTEVLTYLSLAKQIFFNNIQKLWNTD